MKQPRLKRPSRYATEELLRRVRRENQKLRDVVDAFRMVAVWYTSRSEGFRKRCSFSVWRDALEALDGVSLKEKP